MEEGKFYNPGLYSVSGTQGDNLVEFAAFIDGLNGFVSESEDQYGPLTSEIVALVSVEAPEEDPEQIPDVEPEKLEEAVTIALGSADTLVKASDKDYEPMFNLLLYILTFSPAGVPDHLGRVLELLAEASATHDVSVLSVLSNLFNLLPASSELRHSVFLTILKIAVATDNTSLLLPQLAKLPTWFEEWELAHADQVKLLFTVAIELEPTNKSAALKYLLDCHTIAKASSVPVSAEATTKLIKLSLSNSAFVEYDSILSAIPETSGDLVDLLKVLVSGTLSQYTEYKVSHPSVVSTYELDDEALTTKMRLLTVASLASSSPSLTVAYASIAAALDISREDVEFWIIDVIRAGLLEGKMSQLESKLFVHRVATRTFGKEEWVDVAHRLDVWKTSLRDVLTVVRNARSTVQSKLAAEEAAAAATNSEVVEVA
ncbi:hypothetical protein V1512DRAFT_252771 [Lipomyces arxii]|uniref:uncharacterized protein n=1 Tax=Lipomyces arxii TaxID=56418 RepID=UPI0034CD9545